MKLKTVGFYKEMLEGKETDESILDSIRKGNPSDTEKICSYLDNGIELVVIPTVCTDVIEPERGTSGVASQYTDGTWLWPGDLSYYVKNYNLKLPDDFITSMHKNKWQIPITIDDLDCDYIEIDGIKMFEDE